MTGAPLEDAVMRQRNASTPPRDALADTSAAPTPGARAYTTTP